MIMEGTGSEVVDIGINNTIEAVAEMYLSGLISEDGVVDGALADRTERLIPEDRT